MELERILLALRNDPSPAYPRGELVADEAAVPASSSRPLSPLPPRAGAPLPAVVDLPPPAGAGVAAGPQPPTESRKLRFMRSSAAFLSAAPPPEPLPPAGPPWQRRRSGF